MKITSKHVLAFMQSKAEEFRNSAPGYCSLYCDVTTYDAEGIVRPKFRAYNEHTGHSPEFETAEQSIKWVAEKTRGRRKSDMLRAKAAEILIQAQGLEAKGQ